MRKKIMSLVFAAVLAAGIAAVLPSGSVEAASKASTKMPAKAKEALYTNQSCNVDSYSITLPANGKVTDVKSSNQSVAAIKYSKVVLNGKTKHSVKITKKKTGTTTLSFKAAGKKFSCKLTVYQYKPAFKSLKFGSKDLTARAKKANDDIISVNGKKKVTVSGRLNSGWKSLKFYYWKAGSSSLKEIKNGSSVTVKDGDSIIVTAYNKKQKVTERFRVTYL